MSSGSPIRLIDASANRAREGLRVMEDLARFSLNDADLSADLKHARHALRAALQSAGLDPLLLAAARDTPGDVGTGVTTPHERDRAGLRGVAIAAGKRVGEALRSLEEATKLLPAAAASAGTIKQLRYRVYDLEKRLILAMGAGDGRQWRLCVLLTQSLCSQHSWDHIAAQALLGGADCLQLREKSLDSAELLDRARRLVDIARPAGASIVINDRPDIALLSGADGVHLGQADLPLAEARRLVGERLLIGVSTSNMQQALAAAQGGADVCGVGPMFPTTTKHKPVLAGPDYLKDYLADPRTARVPHLAIGGITPESARALAAAGCRGVAVSSAVCASPDPRGACERLIESLGAPPAA